MEQSKVVKELRAQHPGTLLLLPNTTGYVLAGDDAKRAAPVFGVELKKRAKGGARIEVLQEDLDDRVQLLLDAGLRVGICDNVGDPAELVPVIVNPREWGERKQPALRVITPPVELRVVCAEDEEVPPGEDFPDDPPETPEEETGPQQPAQTTTTTAVVAATKEGPDMQGRLLIPCRLKALTLAAADVSTRYAMNGVRLLRTKAGFQAQATDGRIAVWVDGPNGNPNESGTRQTFATILRHHTDASEVLIPNEAWERGLGQGKKDMLAGIALGVRQTGIAVDEELLRTPPLEGHFPDIRLVAKGCNKPPIVTIHVGPANLARLCKLWQAMGAEKITLLIYGNSVPLGLAGRSEDGMVLSGLIMPLT